MISLHHRRATSTPASVSLAFSMQALGLTPASIFHRPRRDHIAHTIGLQRTDYAGPLHLFDHARGAVVADLEAALDAGDRRAPRFGDELHGLIIKWSALGVTAHFACETGAAVADIAFDIQNFVEIIGRAAHFELLDHLVHFLVGHEGAVQAHGHAGAGCEIEHVAVAEQMLGALLVEYRARINPRRHLEGDTRWDVGLDEARDDVDRRPLGGEHEMNAGGARLLG